MEFTRRNFVSGAAAGLGTVAIASALPAGAVAATADGAVIYEGYSLGYRGEIKVHVTIQDGQIVAIDTVKWTETPIEVSQHARDIIPERVLEAQSVEVDNVTGATMSSLGMKAAISDALEKAGILDKFQDPAPIVPDGTAQDAECDILVVGAGIGGVMAACYAKEEHLGGMQNNLNVMLIERNEYIGGNCLVSDGSVMCLSNLDDTSYFDSNFDDYFQPENGTYFGETGNPPEDMNAELAYKVMVEGAETIKEMHDAGFAIQTNNIMGRAQFTLKPYIGYFSCYTFSDASYDGGNWPWSSGKFGIFLREMLDATDIDTRLNTEAQSLIIEDGAVVGVHVTDAYHGEYDIRAKKVILAGGGIGKNLEMLERYAPDTVNMTSYTISGQGKCMQMAADQVDAVVCGNSQFGAVSQDIYLGMYNNLGTEWSHNNNLVWLNDEGLRYVYDGNVANDYPKRSKQQVLTSKQTGAHAWGICDSNNPAHEAVDAVEFDDSLPRIHDDIHKADTLEELFTEIGIDVEQGLATVAQYNDWCTQGVDDPDFGVPNVLLTPVTEPPFYAVSLVATPYDSGVGLKVTGDCEVLNSAGEIVPNLYAIGVMAWSGAYVWYIGHAIPTGRIAAEHARDAVLHQVAWQPAGNGLELPSFASGQEALEEALASVAE